MELYINIIFRTENNQEQIDSQKRPFLDARLEIEQGVNERAEVSQDGLNDPLWPLTGYEIKKVIKYNF